MADHDPQYTIYYTIVNRMHLLEDLIGHPNASDADKHHLLMAQDAHQLLSIHMESYNQYDNESLLSCPSSSQRSVFEILDPGTLNTVFHQGELPNLLPLLIYCKHWGEKVDMPFTHPLAADIISLLNKALPQPCKGTHPQTGGGGAGGRMVCVGGT